jgi:hypothetical protein
MNPSTAPSSYCLGVWCFLKNPGIYLTSVWASPFVFVRHSNAAAKSWTPGLAVQAVIGLASELDFNGWEPQAGGDVFH